MKTKPSADVGKKELVTKRDKSKDKAKKDVEIPKPEEQKKEEDILSEKNPSVAITDSSNAEVKADNKEAVEEANSGDKEITVK